MHTALTRARLLLSVLLLSVVGRCPAVCAEPLPVQALSLTAPITLDGRLAEADWQTGPWSTGFHLLDRAEDLATVQTRFRVRFDAAHLYVGIEADEPQPGRLLAEVADRDGPVFHDDCLEIMVDATGQRVEYFHFIVNPRGALYDAQMRQGGNVRSAAWNSSAVAAAWVANDRWSAELAIPLVELGITPASAGDWAINVARERRGGGEELSTYAPLSGGFHQATQYARLQLPGADLGRFLWDLRYPHEERVVPDTQDRPVLLASTRLTNGTGQRRAYQLRGVLGSAIGPWVQGVLEPGATREEKVRIPGIQIGPGVLRLELTAAGDTTSLVAVRQIEITTSYTPLSVRVTQPCYREAIYATEEVPEIVFEVRSDLPDERLVGLVIRAALRERATLAGSTAPIGTPVIDPGAGRVISTISQRAAASVSLRLPAGSLPVGEYLLEVALVDGQSGQTRHRVTEWLRKLAPAANEWRLDAQRVLRHNGEPVLPFGWFSMPPEAMADTGHAYTLIQSYSGYWQSVEELRRFLDQVAAAGTAATIYPYPYPEFVEPEAAWRRPLSPKEEEDLRLRVRALKDHPGLFAWYMADEPELIPALPARCRRIYEVVRDEDPYHPCIMLNDTEEGIQIYREGGDVLMPDPYPLFLQGGLAAQPLEKVGRFIRTAREAAGSGQAVWVTPQGFNYGDYGRQNNRAPRLLELRNQFYQAAVYGARGFLWYTYSQVPNYPDLEIGMRWLSHEAADLRPWLLAPLESPAVEVTSPRPEQVHATLRRAGSHLVLIAVSTDTQAQDVTLRVPDLSGVDRLQVVSESRSVPLRQGALQDRFEIYQTHIYTTDPILGARQDIAVPLAAIARADSARHQPGNLAFETSGVRVTVSSEARYGSTPTRLTDGVTHGMCWRDGTPDEVPDWARLSWPKEQALARVKVWAGGVAAIEAQVPGGKDGWRTVGRATTDTDGVLEIVLEPRVVTRELNLLITANLPGQRETLIYEVEAYGE